MSYYRGPYGGGGMTLAFPPVTPMVKVILWTLGACFFLQYFFTRAGLGIVPAYLALSPDMLLRPPFAIWQLATYALLHGNLWHLLGNLFGIWMFGGDVERMLGSRGFLRFFLITILGGGLAHAVLGLLAKNPVPVIGASAAVLGLVLAFAMFYPDRRVILFPIPIPVTARTLALIYGAIDLYLAIEANPGDPTAHIAHLGGLAAAYLYIKGFIRPGGWRLGLRWPRRRRGFRVIRGRRDDPFDIN
ncbi:MAG: rhomboid family intramembrane serine protease [Acidobacteria bacterium]|nr:rhomboid family intramembrane serine protease [Acidobacteriota bacterium]